MVTEAGLKMADLMVLMWIETTRGRMCLCM